VYFFPKTRLGFFHIPKTAGISLTNFLTGALTRHGDSPIHVVLESHHEPLVNKKKVLGDAVFDDSIIITSIRNPYAVVVSLYFWCKKLFNWHTSQSTIGELLARYPYVAEVVALDFNSYVDWHVDRMRPYWEYLCINGEIPKNVRFVRVEDLTGDLNNVLNQELHLDLEITVGVAPDSTSLHGPVMSYLDSLAIKKINEKYNWAFGSFYQNVRVEK